MVSFLLFKILSLNSKTIGNFYATGHNNGHIFYLYVTTNNQDGHYAIGNIKIELGSDKKSIKQVIGNFIFTYE